MPDSGEIAIITQARTGSTRLPGKIFIPVLGKPVLIHHLERLVESKLPVIVATSTELSDDQVAGFCKEYAVNCSRGPLDDVLSRFYSCAKENKLKHIVRVTSDCPLIDGKIIAKAAEEYLALEREDVYYSNCIKRTYPRGFDFEIFSFKLLEEAWEKASAANLREHVTPYINQNLSGHVALMDLTRSSDASKYRITLDTAEDLILIKTLIEKYRADQMNAEQIISLMDTHPELALINQHIEQKKV
ncbi:MAG TPA: glycosyltransferase family protein [Cytophagaceae bacterium]|jgi:spore coat polysaccharide biosynthesis protein SpsF|nr:glycosyltransferase family protein [Cytophagaceae bacterium]